MLSRAAIRIPCPADGSDRGVSRPIQLHEGLAGRRGKIAVRRPAAGERQRADPAAAPEQPHRPHAHGVAEPIKGRPPGHERPQPDAVADRGRLQPLAPAPVAPAAEQRRQRDVDRADLLAAAVHGAGVRQVARLGEAVEGRGEDSAHRPRIDGAVGVAADLAVDDAVVHAGAAADAAQHLLQPVAEHARSGRCRRGRCASPRGRRRRPAASGRSGRSCTGSARRPWPSGPAGAAWPWRAPSRAPASRSRPSRCAPAAGSW